MIVRWPGVVEPGSTSDVPVIGMDLFPTFGELAEVRVEGPLDGESIVPVWKGEEPDSLKNRTLSWHFPYYHPENPDVS